MVEAGHWSTRGSRARIANYLPLLIRRRVKRTLQATA